MSIRRLPVLAILFLALVGWPKAADAQQNASPCSQPEASQFDFWIGEWEVRSAGGQLAGTNRITKEIGGCVLHERYSTPSGYEGESLNVYDASRGVWHQTWVDNQGLLLSLEGGFHDGTMVLEGVTKTQDGEAIQRISWSLIDGGPDVRQLWETSTDGGSTWTTAFDGIYVRTDS